MRLAALFSGGKDSTAAIWKAKKEGHEVKYLITILARNQDSYMYDVINVSLTKLQAEALDIPLVYHESSGEKEKEVEDLKNILKRIGNIDGVVCGALASEYQRSRIQKICNELDLKMLAPLWHTDLEKYLNELLENGFEIIFTRVQAEGFDEKWLGRKLDKQAIKDLLALRERYKINIAGEGGEFETKVLDCPLFKKRITILRAEKNWFGDWGVFVVKETTLADKCE